MTAVIQTDTSTYTRLAGGRLLLARVGWLLTVGLAAVGIIVLVPAYIAYLQDGGGFAEAPQEMGIPIPAPVYAVYLVVLSLLQFIVFSLVGLLIFQRKSDDWWAILVSVTLVTFGGYSSSFTAPEVIDEIGIFRPLIFLLIGISNAAFVAFLYIFPDGRFYPRWVKWPVFAWVVWSLAIGVFPDAPFSRFRLPATIQFIVPLAAYGGSVAVQTYRETHYYTPAQKQQTKWVMMGLLMSLVGGYLVFMWPPLMFPVLNETGVPALVYTLVSRLVGTLSLIAIPVGLAFSMLRYRLWDVDFLINRSVVYGGLTAALIALFALITGVSQLLLRHMSDGMHAGIALGVSGVAFGLLFMPARRRLQRWVDSRLYGIKIDYNKTPAPTPPLAGVVTMGTRLGSYEVTGALGKGGMAEVFKGQHTTLGREVAIKTLPVNLAADPEFRKRFEREARTVAALKHHNIVELFDSGEADGTVYMVMEYIKGGDLSDRLAQDTPMPIDEVRRLVSDISGALDYAHQNGVVHRDVKPSNVMLQPHNGGARPVLTDFGIARIVGGATRITHTGMIGTFDYIAPEQIRDAADVDGRADIYSLGVMLFQMLTGRLPFTASNPGALLIAHLNQPAPDPRTVRADIPEGLAEATLRALEKDPARRFQTAGEFAAAL